MLVADVSTVCWEGIQVRKKKVHFQQHISLHHSIGIKHLLNQLSVVGHFEVAQKFVSNQSECFWR
jgi:hypothetical protein